MKMWNVDLVNTGDGPDWSWVGLASSPEQAIEKALKHVGGTAHFEVGACERTNEISFRIETGELGETLQFKEEK